MAQGTDIRQLDVYTNGAKQGVLTKDGLIYDFTYHASSELVSLIMPNDKLNWRSLPGVLHPTFQMNLPEGALKEKIKEHFGKVTIMDDMGLLGLIGPHMLGRIKFGSQNMVVTKNKQVEISELLNPHEADYFESLMETYAIKSGISGVQPKVLIEAMDRHTLKLESLIVKAWTDEFPELAANEYFCMRACLHAGLDVPEFYMSNDRKMFIMKRFDIQEEQYLGFEDMCSILSKNSDDKYEGSYEDIAKVLKNGITDSSKSLEQLFKALVMNHLLKNGDAHLKNFGLIYEGNGEKCRMAPIYDVVTTTIYKPKDIPALKLSGGRKWWIEKTYHTFAKMTCKIPDERYREIIKECEAGINKAKDEICEYVKNHPDFSKIADKLLEQWQEHFSSKIE
jgi:serine/threonine-protein kinase HipA